MFFHHAMAFADTLSAASTPPTPAAEIDAATWPSQVLGFKLAPDADAKMHFESLEPLVFADCQHTAAALIVAALNSECW